MKARLSHDTRKKCRDCVDAWALYFPYPKWMREEYGAFGTYLGCKPTDDGMIRCTWGTDECLPCQGRPYLGKRVDVKTTPKAFRNLFRQYEKLWNNAITRNTEKAWEAWNKA